MIRPKLLTVGEGGDAYIGEVLFEDPGEFTWTVPLTVRRLHACCIGAGCQATATNGYDGGGGGGLGWKNNIDVEPGEKLAITVGKAESNPFSINKQGSGIYRTDDNGNRVGSPIVLGGTARGREGGNYIGDGGGYGGRGDDQRGGGGFANTGGGGGAGGYRGNGGDASGSDLPSGAGQGGGGSGGTSGYDDWINGLNQKSTRGGGVGIMGQGAGGPAVDNPYPGGANAGIAGSGGDKWKYGAGGTGMQDENMPVEQVPENKRAGHGAVRIIWGIEYSYPDNAQLES